MASPSYTFPSKGITLPICTTTLSPGLTSFEDTRTSFPSTDSHTLLILSDILLARSPTDFLCVHSSSISPMPSINIIEPAVPMSSLRMDTPIAVASRTGTSILCLSKVLIPFPKYLNDFDITIKALTGNGMKNLVA